jgi:hypothetical protein
VLLIVSLVWQARRGVASATWKHDREFSRCAAGASAWRRELGLAISQADWLIEAPRLPSRIRGSYQGTIDNLAVALPETVQRLDEVEHYAPGIRPIRISFGVLLDALWRTLPGSHDDDRRPTGRVISRVTCGRLFEKSVLSQTAAAIAFAPGELNWRPVCTCQGPGAG